MSKTKSIFPNKLGQSAELIIWESSIDGRQRSISLENWQLDAIQIILGLNWTEDGEGIRMFQAEAVKKFLLKTGIQNLVEVEK